GNYRQPRRRRGATPILDGDEQPAHRTQVYAFDRLHDLHFAPDGILYPQFGIARFVCHVSDLLSVGRVAWRGDVELAVGQWKRLAAAADRRGPQLMPLPSEVRGIDDALALRGPVRPRAPARLFVSHQHRRLRAVERHPPDAAGAVRHFRVANVQDFPPVGRPRRMKFMIVRAVVVAFHFALALLEQRGSIKRPVLDTSDEDVKAAGTAGRDKGQARAVGRPARLEVYGAVAGQ